MIRRLSICAAVLFAASTARAAPLPDVAPWAQRFTVAALRNDPGEILSALRDVADPRFHDDALGGILQKLDAVVGAAPGSYAEQFDRRSLGTFLQRINVAVRFPKTFLFYSVTFMRATDGWTMVQFDYNTDVNEILALKWPE